MPASAFGLALALAGLAACGSSPEPYTACLPVEGEAVAPASLTFLFTGAVDGNLEPCG